MRHSLSITLGLMAISSATPTGPGSGSPVVPRPVVQPFPLDTGHSRVMHSTRSSNKTCVVPPSQNGSDSSPAILSAFQSCNQGGTVVLDADYTIASPLNLTFLQSVDVALTGTINFADDIAYWTSGGAYPITYQNSSAFWIIGGTDVNIYGGGTGTLNGNGELWWNTSLTNDTLRRPILFVADGLEGATISGLNLVNPPNVSRLSSTRRDLTSDRKLVVQPYREQHRRRGQRLEPLCEVEHRRSYAELRWMGHLSIRLHRPAELRHKQR